MSQHHMKSKVFPIKEKQEFAKRILSHSIPILLNLSDIIVHKV